MIPILLTPVSHRFVATISLIQWFEYLKLRPASCADRDSFVRGGLTLISFFSGARFGKPPKAGNNWPASETPLKWHTMLPHLMVLSKGLLKWGIDNLDLL